MSLSSFFLSDKRPVFLKNIRCRPMFGGHGYYINGKMFALVREKSLYLKAGSNNVADFLLTGQLPYIHQCFGEYFPTNFYSVPLNIVEDEVQLTRWIAKAIRQLAQAKESAKASSALDSRQKKTAVIRSAVSNTFLF
ncbi:TfoX/Sxy family protein [Pseudovibrio sp. Alg231-02]|uniref:TfoX/Sxy family protein n=1 Tax=Pseudovibrio sp. Alg231-02 TaxID=1922223 RepID=UPI000D54C573|nr:TfoX/Sxy family protein [Pseudovibrio sp. Alg231-02]